jgi:peptide deformylase
MALRTIRKYGDELLRKKSRTVDEVTDRIKVLIKDMIETMYDAQGAGLAAPQVGILKRIFVVDILDGKGARVFINPEFIEKEGSQKDVEGCLSVPGRQGEVDRPNKVKIKALNENGEEFVLEAEGYLARAICHEYDHLEGILFVDYLQ